MSDTTKSSVNTKEQERGYVESSPKLPYVIDPTVAADSVRSHREPLLNLINHCLSSLANSLLAKSIIPRDVYKKVCNPHLEDSERGGALLDCVETRIRLKASCFATFIDVLKSEPFLSDLAEELVQSYCQGHLISQGPPLQPSGPLQGANGGTYSNATTGDAAATDYGTVVLRIDDLGDVFELVEEVSAKWKLLCMRLGIKSATRDTIEVNNPRDAVSCLCAVLEEWLKLNYDYERHGKPSWKNLAEAVKIIDRTVYKKILKKCGGIA